ncbi:DHA2 family efflux MFS transporter permease subunit [Brevibacterium permense]|uniref:MFS transporter n=1 Tax=Brevibacterium permense TaxID=234834 RepID=UPI0021D19016|nr:MFS transporter [Brevibacterium permense]MCU4295588.1 DHA2 family efflux MFS transporter permease subunit [Brevibacterium permense]
MTTPSTESTSSTAPAGQRAEAPTRKGLLVPMLVVSGGQLLIVLNDVIANVGLPAIQADLGMSAGTMPWVVNAYILLFGALLLFGGRLGDLYGRRRLLRIGLIVFMAGALLAGLSTSGIMIILARAIQGVGAALTAPNVLASINSTFPAGKQRTTALALYGAMSGLGIAVGLLVGGVLAGTLGWNWMFYLNLPIGLILLAGTRTLVEADSHQGRLDMPGAVLGTGAMASLVYAITRGGEHGWSDPVTLGSLGAAAVLLLVFVLVQSRTSDPMLPLRIFGNRNRSGAYFGMLMVSFGPLGMFYLLNLYMQYVLDFTPLQTGLAWLPFAIGIVLGAGISSKLAASLAPRWVIGVGMLIAAAGLFSLTFIGTDTSYWAHLMPAIFATAFGFALNFVPLTSAAVSSAAPQDTGIASALLNTGQQIGTAMGMAVTSSIAVAITSNHVPDALARLAQGRKDGDAALITQSAEALVTGYTGALTVGAISLLAAAVITAIIVDAERPAA